MSNEVQRPDLNQMQIWQHLFNFFVLNRYNVIISKHQRKRMVNMKKLVNVTFSYGRNRGSIFQFFARKFDRRKRRGR